MQRFIQCLAIFLVVLSACDTENNVDPRFEDYFIKYHGTEGNHEGVDLEQVEDGYVLLGKRTRTGQTTGGILIKTDLLGNEQWSTTFGSELELSVTDLEQDENGNFVVIADINISVTDKDVLVMKFDAFGIRTDSAVFGNTGFVEQSNHLLITSDGDYIITGSTSDVNTLKPGFNPDTDLLDIYSLRLSPSLELRNESLWRRVSGFPGIDEGVAVLETTSGFIFYGTTDRPNSNDQQDLFNMFLFTTNRQGTPTSDVAFQWFGTLSDEIASDITTTSDGSRVMIGTSTNQSGLDQVFIARVRNDNTFITSEVLRTTEGTSGVSIVEAKSGGLLVLGLKPVNDGATIYLAKTSIDGAIEWQRDFGGLDENSARKISQTQSGEILIIGTIELDTQKKIALFKTNSKGELKP